MMLVWSLLGCEQAPLKAYQWQIPKDYPKPQVPIDNPMSEEKVRLGRFLFYDKNLSANQTQSCASCHQQRYAFAEPRKVSIGSTGQLHRRNSLALVNVAYNKTLTWAHPSLDSIERQQLLPMFGESPIELGITGNEARVLARFEQPQYIAMFDLAFDQTKVNFDLINKALASFVRSLVSFNSDFDRYAYAMDDTALNDSQVRGMNLFFSEKLECHHCHGGFNFTQSTTHTKQLLNRRPFHNNGLYNIDGKGGYPKTDIGLAEISLSSRDMGAFRAPTLRNIALTAPYMHDGSIDTLDQVIDHYAKGGVIYGKDAKQKLTSPFVKGFDLSPADKADLLAFLHSLTDESFISHPKFSTPFK